MNNRFKSLILFLITVGCFVSSVFLMKSYDFDATESECKDQNKTCKGEPTCCSQWDGSQCRKGTKKSGVCTSPGHATPLIFMIIGGIFLIASIYFFFKHNN